MRLVVLWVVIASLSFSSMHDLFLYSTHTSSQTCMVDDAPSCDASASCEVHNLLHFVAIVDLDAIAFHPLEVSSLSFHKRTLNLSTYYQNLYRPPIA
ncbi:MAG: hypothetical protein U9N49_08855 [Campylobacterota bacterium]|nr:hypothetical protein [Campylobacterota bacterium]